jgi:hypothetical protein
MVRTSCLQQLFSIEDAHIDQSLAELKHSVISKLTSYLTEQTDEAPWGVLKQRFAEGGSTDLFELRMLRSDLLPGKWIIDDEKGLKRFGLKSGSPLLVVPKPVPSHRSRLLGAQALSGETHLPAPTSLDVFVTRRIPLPDRQTTVPVDEDEKSDHGLAEGDSVGTSRQFSELMWPPMACSVNREGTAHTFDEFRKEVAKVANVDEEFAVLARQEFSKFSWTALSSNMMNKKKGKTKSKALKGGARSVCQGPFYVKPGDLIGVLDSREVVLSENQVASDYLMATAFDTAADFEGREATRLVDREKRKQGSEVQRKRTQETVLNLGHSSYNWSDSEDDEDD